MYNCNCRRIYKSVAAVVDADNLVIYFVTDFDVPQPRQKFDFKICNEVPAEGESLPVVFSIGGTEYKFINKYGEPAVGSDLQRGCIYYGYFAGLSSDHFIACNAPNNCCC